MSNKTQLQTNNTNLASYTDRVSALIDVANSLPEAGGSSGGGNIETITINLSYEPEPGAESIIYYIDSSMSLKSEVIGISSHTIVKGTIFVITNYGDSNADSCMAICGNGMYKAFLATK